MERTGFEARANLWIALRATGVTLLLTGILYPLTVTALAQLAFPRRARGSPVQDDSGRLVGSELIAQEFTGAAYVHPRPSAAGSGYDALASGGSNLGPTSRRLTERAAALARALLEENPDAPSPIPLELVTASASGLDPHLSPAAVLWQLPRISKARGVSVERLREAVEVHVEERTFGILGERRVNVLLLNLALDRQFGAPTAPVGASP